MNYGTFCWADLLSLCLTETILVIISQRSQSCMMAKRSISVLALCAQLMLFIAVSSDGAEGLLEKNWRQCVYKTLHDSRDTGLIKVWTWTFPKTKFFK